MNMKKWIYIYKYLKFHVFNYMPTFINYINKIKMQINIKSDVLQPIPIKRKIIGLP